MAHEGSTPNTSPNSHQPSDSNPSGGTDGNLSEGRAVYNMISDNVVGVNVRWRDNVFQAVFTLVATILGAAIGAALPWLSGGEVPMLVGVIIGLILGAVLGVLTSGIYLMIYRAARHLRGKHD